MWKRQGVKMRGYTWTPWVISIWLTVVLPVAVPNAAGAQQESDKPPSPPASTSPSFDVHHDLESSFSLPSLPSITSTSREIIYAPSLTVLSSAVPSHPPSGDLKDRILLKLLSDDQLQQLAGEDAVRDGGSGDVGNESGQGPSKTVDLQGVDIVGISADLAAELRKLYESTVRNSTTDLPARERRQAENGVKAEVVNVENEANGTAVTLDFFLKQDGKVVPMTTALENLQQLSSEEMEALLQVPVVAPLEVVRKTAEQEQPSSAKVAPPVVLLTSLHTQQKIFTTLILPTSASSALKETQASEQTTMASSKELFQEVDSAVLSTTEESLDYLQTVDLDSSGLKPESEAADVSAEHTVLNLVHTSASVWQEVDLEFFSSEEHQTTADAFSGDSTEQIIMNSALTDSKLVINTQPVKSAEVTFSISQPALRLTPSSSVSAQLGIQPTEEQPHTVTQFYILSVKPSKVTQSVSEYQTEADNTPEFSGASVTSSSTHVISYNSPIVVDLPSPSPGSSLLSSPSVSQQPMANPVSVLASSLKEESVSVLDFLSTTAMQPSSNAEYSETSRQSAAEEQVVSEKMNISDISVHIQPSFTSEFLSVTSFAKNDGFTDDSMFTPEETLAVVDTSVVSKSVSLDSTFATDRMSAVLFENADLNIHSSSTSVSFVDDVSSEATTEQPSLPFFTSQTVAPDFLQTDRSEGVSEPTSSLLLLISTVQLPTSFKEQASTSDFQNQETSATLPFSPAENRVPLSATSALYSDLYSSQTVKETSVLVSSELFSSSNMEVTLLFPAQTAWQASSMSHSEYSSLQNDQSLLSGETEGSSSLTGDVLEYGSMSSSSFTDSTAGSTVASDSSPSSTNVHSGLVSSSETIHSSQNTEHYFQNSVDVFGESMQVTPSLPELMSQSDMSSGKDGAAVTHTENVATGSQETFSTPSSSDRLLTSEKPSVDATTVSPWIVSSASEQRVELSETNTSASSLSDRTQSVSTSEAPFLLYESLESESVTGSAFTETGSFSSVDTSTVLETISSTSSQNSFLQPSSLLSESSSDFSAPSVLHVTPLQASFISDDGHVEPSIQPSESLFVKETSLENSSKPTSFILSSFSEQEQENRSAFSSPVTEQTVSGIQMPSQPSAEMSVSLTSELSFSNPPALDNFSASVFEVYSSSSGLNPSHSTFSKSLSSFLSEESAQDVLSPSTAYMSHDVLPTHFTPYSTSVADQATASDDLSSELLLSGTPIVAESFELTAPSGLLSFDIVDSTSSLTVLSSDSPVSPQGTFSTVAPPGASTMSLEYFDVNSLSVTPTHNSDTLIDSRSAYSRVVEPSLETILGDVTAISQPSFTETESNLETEVSGTVPIELLVTTNTPYLETSSLIGTYHAPSEETSSSNLDTSSVDHTLPVDLLSSSVLSPLSPTPSDALITTSPSEAFSNMTSTELQILPTRTYSANQQTFGGPNVTSSLQIQSSLTTLFLPAFSASSGEFTFVTGPTVDACATMLSSSTNGSQTVPTNTFSPTPTVSVAEVPSSSDVNQSSSHVTQPAQQPPASFLRIQIRVDPEVDVKSPGFLQWIKQALIRLYLAALRASEGASPSSPVRKRRQTQEQEQVEAQVLGVQRDVDNSSVVNLDFTVTQADRQVPADKALVVLETLTHQEMTVIVNFTVLDLTKEISVNATLTVDDPVGSAFVITTKDGVEFVIPTPSMTPVWSLPSVSATPSTSLSSPSPSPSLTESLDIVSTSVPGTASVSTSQLEPTLSTITSSSVVTDASVSLPEYTVTTALFSSSATSAILDSSVSFSVSPTDILSSTLPSLVTTESPTSPASSSPALTSLSSVVTETSVGTTELLSSSSQASPTASSLETVELSSSLLIVLSSESLPDQTVTPSLPVPTSATLSISSDSSLVTMPAVTSEVTDTEGVTTSVVTPSVSVTSTMVPPSESLTSAEVTSSVPVTSAAVTPSESVTSEEVTSSVSVSSVSVGEVTTSAIETGTLTSIQSPSASVTSTMTVAPSSPVDSTFSSAVSSNISVLTTVTTISTTSIEPPSPVQSTSTAPSEITVSPESSITLTSVYSTTADIASSPTVIPESTTATTSEVIPSSSSSVESLSPETTLAASSDISTDISSSVPVSPAVSPTPSLPSSIPATSEATESAVATDSTLSATVPISPSPTMSTVPSSSVTPTTPPPSTTPIPDSVRDALMVIDVEVKLTENVQSEEFKGKMKRGLALVYQEALESRKKRSVSSDDVIEQVRQHVRLRRQAQPNVEAEVTEVVRNSTNPRITNVTFYVMTDGAPVPASTASVNINKFSPNEVSAILAYPVVSSYVRPATAVQTTQPEEFDDGVGVMFVVAIVLPSVLLLLLLVVLSFILLRSCSGPPPPSTVIDVVPTKYQRGESLDDYNLHVDVERGEIVDLTPHQTPDPNYPRPSKSLRKSDLSSLHQGKDDTLDSKRQMIDKWLQGDQARPRASLASEVSMARSDTFLYRKQQSKRSKRGGGGRDKKERKGSTHLEVPQEPYKEYLQALKLPETDLDRNEALSASRRYGSGDRSTRSRESFAMEERRSNEGEEHQQRSLTPDQWQQQHSPHSQRSSSSKRQPQARPRTSFVGKLRESVRKRKRSLTPEYNFMTQSTLLSGMADSSLTLPGSRDTSLEESRDEDTHHTDASDEFTVIVPMSRMSSRDRLESNSTCTSPVIIEPEQADVHSSQNKAYQPSKERLDSEEDKTPRPLSAKSHLKQSRSGIVSTLDRGVQTAESFRDAFPEAENTKMTLEAKAVQSQEELSEEGHTTTCRTMQTQTSFSSSDISMDDEVRAGVRMKSVAVGRNTVNAKTQTPREERKHKTKRKSNKAEPSHILSVSSAAKTVSTERLIQSDTSMEDDQIEEECLPMRIEPFAKMSQIQIPAADKGEKTLPVKFRRNLFERPDEPEPVETKPMPNRCPEHDLPRHYQQQFHKPGRHMRAQPQSSCGIVDPDQRRQNIVIARQHLLQQQQQEAVSHAHRQQLEQQARQLVNEACILTPAQTAQRPVHNQTWMNQILPGAGLPNVASHAPGAPGPYAFPQAHEELMQAVRSELKRMQQE